MPSNLDSIVGHVPYLRRYARALNGTQNLGDRTVRMCLQAVADDPGCIQGDQPIRRQLYRQFHITMTNVVNGPPACRSHSASRGLEVLDSHVRSLPTRERQVLLLTMVERFSIEDVAFILGLTLVETQGLLDRARRDLMGQCATTVLVIEDEPVIAFDIAGILMEMGHRVVGTAATRSKPSPRRAKRSSGWCSPISDWMTVAPASMR